MIEFGGLEGPSTDYASSRVVLLPAPLERTTSYGRGAAGGPEAILRASHQVELWDEQLGTEPFRVGIATRPPLSLDRGSIEECLDRIEEEARRHLRAGKFLVTLGGEHSLSLAPVRAARDLHGDVGVIQFDAHADLRESYQGSPYSHACVMRRIVELGAPTLAVGIRALSRPEAELIESRELPTIWGHELGDLDEAAFARRLAGLPHRVYLTFDVDFFDPALVPATGTPEPGGGAWYPTLALLRALFRAKEVVAMDLVELAPLADQPASDFLVARLLYKCLGFLSAQ